jgi:hypothetical protein
MIILYRAYKYAIYLYRAASGIVCYVIRAFSIKRKEGLHQ